MKYYIITLFLIGQLLTSIKGSSQSIEPKPTTELTERLSDKQKMNQQETYRPSIHFTPEKNWMNDPNGLVYYKGLYHLFYQNFPDATHWGPMHWGHATSKDLLNWQRQPIALYPDSLGYIFSGSVVVDFNNTSGFGRNGQPPLVAIFTHHNIELEKKGTNAQYQSIAYSLDDGKTWTKYKGNPVLPNPGISDFRDPKVSWYARDKKWIMSLATKDRITFYSSANLINWQKESDFGANEGAHGGVWECPDLFPLKLNGQTYWVLLVSINPGGPNGGSATQYFVGQFDGHRFKANDTTTRWVDYGADNYAGVTFENTGNRRIFMGWMNNWLYANIVPTQSWRGSATLPRELHLVHGPEGKILLANVPVQELESLKVSPSTVKLQNLSVKDMKVTKQLKVNTPFRLRLEGDKLNTFALTLESQDGKHFTLGYDSRTKQYYTDRTQSGETSFSAEFPKLHFAPRNSASKVWHLDLIVDEASVEIFADGGVTNFTDLFFPSGKLKLLKLSAPTAIKITELTYTPLKTASIH